MCCLRPQVMREGVNERCKRRERGRMGEKKVMREEGREENGEEVGREEGKEGRRRRKKGK